MIDDIHHFLEKYDSQTRQRFLLLYDLIYESTTRDIEEKLWANLPSFYADTHFVRLIPFKDHINIEAKAVVSHKNALSGYKMTPKGMLQIYHTQPIPREVLKRIFEESL